MSYKRGKTGELEVARFLREAGIHAERNLNEARSGNTGDLDLNVPFEVQVKARKQPSPWKAVEEAEEAVQRAAEERDRPGRYAVAALKRKNGQGKPADRIVCMPWEDFRELVALLKSNDAW